MALEATRQRHEILAQHRHLLELAARIEAFVQEDSGQLGNATTWRARLTDLLAEFIRHLLNHFEAEVRTTSLENASQNHPLAAELRALDEEHQTLQLAFEQAHRMVLSEVALPRVRAHIAQAIFAFRDHEAREDALFADMP